jgi:hypothetical protein
MPVLFSNEEYADMHLCRVFAMEMHKRQKWNIEGVFCRGDILVVKFLLLYTDAFEKQVALTFSILGTTRH